MYSRNVADHDFILQVRPGSSSTSSGSPDKTRLSRSDQWTKDVIEYLQYLLDEFVSKNNSQSTMHTKDRSPQFAYTGSIQHKSDSVLALVDGEEPSLHFKWWYVVRIIQWHYAEGLLLPSLIIDWVLNQLQVIFLAAFSSQHRHPSRGQNVWVG